MDTCSLGYVWVVLQRALRRGLIPLDLFISITIDLLFGKRGSPLLLLLCGEVSHYLELILLPFWPALTVKAAVFAQLSEKKKKKKKKSPKPLAVLCSLEFVF